MTGIELVLWLAIMLPLSWWLVFAIVARKITPEPTPARCNHRQHRLRQRRARRRARGTDLPGDR